MRASKLALLLGAWAVSGCDGGGSDISGESDQDPSLAKATPAQQQARSASASGVAEAASADAPDPIEHQPKRTALVSLDGNSRPAAVNLVKPGPRVFSVHLETWVHERPDPSSRKLGYMRAGASSPTSAKAAGFAQCKGGWYPVEPGGFVCVGDRATLDAKHPIVLATQEHRPDHMRKLPYIYGTVRRPGPIYQRLPSPEQMRKVEKDVDDRMERWLEAEGEIGASYAQHVWLGAGAEAEVPSPADIWKEGRSEGVPFFLDNGALAPNLLRLKRTEEDVVLERMRPKVGYSFLQTFLHAGRRWGMTTGLRVMPTDRLRPIQGSDLHGYRIPEDIDIPFAIIRKKTARFWVYKKSGGKLIKGKNAAYGSAVKLTGKKKFFNKILHYQTDDGRYVRDRDASYVRGAKRMPKWGKNGEKWIDVSLTPQLLKLYEGEKLVYATLISSGEAGLEDPKHTTATKRGIFRIHTKHITATMDSDEIGEEFELRDVPYVQYFDKEGYALHGAYWHDRFGTPKSHGCLNLSPEDARRIFHWTEPQVPPGWHAALLPLKGTVIFIHP